jgi:hypothetical protein
LPAGSTAQFSDGPRGINPFRDHMKYLQEQLVLAGTGGLLTMLAMPTGIGAGASGEHADVFATIARAEARRISEIFQKQHDARFLSNTFPGKPILAYFEIAAQESVDVGEIITHATTLATAGYQIDPAELAEKTGYKISVRPLPAAPETAPHQFTNRSFDGAGLPSPRQQTGTGASRLQNRATDKFASALGVDSVWLSPVADLLAEIERKAADKTISDADLAVFLESATAQLPEIFDRMDHDALAELLEAALGTAALEGVKAGIAAKKPKTRQDAP